VVRDLSKRAGPDRTHRGVRHEAEALSEALKTLHGPIGDFDRESTVGVQSFRERDALAQSIEHVEVALRVLGDDHVEAVRAEVDGGDGFDRLALHRREPAIRRARWNTERATSSRARCASGHGRDDAAESKRNERSVESMETCARAYRVAMRSTIASDR
jgi:hypothetical protein